MSILKISAFRNPVKVTSKEVILLNELTVSTDVPSEGVTVLNEGTPNKVITPDEVTSHDGITSNETSYEITASKELLLDKVRSNHVTLNDVALGKFLSIKASSNDVTLGKLMPNMMFSNEMITSNEVTSRELMAPNEVTLNKMTMLNEITPNEVIASNEVTFSEATVSNKVASKAVSASNEIISTQVIVSNEIISNEMMLSNEKISNDEITSNENISNDEITSNEGTTKMNSPNDVASDQGIISNEIISNEVFVSNDITANKMIRPILTEATTKETSNDVASDEVIVQNGVTSYDLIISTAITINEITASHTVILDDKISSELTFSEMKLDKVMSNAVTCELTLPNTVTSNKAERLDKVALNVVTLNKVVSSNKVISNEMVINDTIASNGATASNETIYVFKTTSNDTVFSCQFDNTASIQDLPNELLDYIFSFLKIQQRIRNELVCKRWRLLGSEMLWSYPTQLRLGVYFHQVQNCILNDDILCSILSRCGRALKDFVLSTYNTELTLKSLTKIGDYCPNLVSVALHLNDTQNACLKPIAQCCPNLKLVQVESFEDPIYNEGIFAIVESCKALECLYISNLEITGDWLCIINPNLKIINLNCCRIMPDSLRILKRRCNVLQEFALKQCKSLDPVILYDMFQHFTETLTVLRVVRHTQVMPWSKLVSVLVNLEALHLFGCSVVDNDLMEVLAENCVKLRILDIGATDVSDNGLIYLKGLPGLKRLNISLDPRILGYGLEALVSKGVLEQVTILSAKDFLKEACSIISVMYPNVRFVME